VIGERCEVHEVLVQDEGWNPVLDRLMRFRRNRSYRTSNLLEYLPDVRRKASDIVVDAAG